MTGHDTQTVDLIGGDVRVSLAFPHPDDLILQIVRRTGTFYEPDVLAFLGRALERVAPERFIVDAGAFVGNHTIYFAAVCRRRVMAFEPNPRTFELLRGNIDRNGLANLVTCVPCALGARAGHGIGVEGDPARSMAHRVDMATPGHTGTIVIQTLDAVLSTEDRSRVALLKIDVEGAELAVLSGASQTIATSQPILCIEVHTASHLWRVFSLLRHLGCHYAIDDCLSHESVPTYVLSPRSSAHDGGLRVLTPWLVRAAIPRRLWPVPAVRRLRSWLRLMAIPK